MTVIDDNSDDERSASLVRAPAEVELFLELGSARDFTVACYELIDLADERLARLDWQSPVEVVDRRKQAFGVPPQLREHVHRAFAEMEQAVGSALTSALDGQEINEKEWAADPFAALARLIDADALVAQFVSHVQTEQVGLPDFTSYFLAYADAVLRRPRSH